MSHAEALLLVVAGLGAGLTGSVAGLSSLVSYPALLLIGLSPLHANVTNTVALVANSAGAALGSRRELAGQWRRLRWLMLQCGLGGALGAALLLTTDESTFTAIVPWLVALGALLLLMRDQIRRWSQRRRRAAALGAEQLPAVTTSWRGHLLIVVVGVYGGYFGAGSGIILLAVLALRTSEPFAITNAVKNVATSTANVVAAVAYMLLAPVAWPPAIALATGGVIGSWLGPQLVRVLPERPLRWAIGAAGLGLSAYLLVG
ncbi:sulfite exporter TauE/SafE family protein [Nocardioides terrisoli]|uniref:sulfite exporter TauE/SafE family protein n=1 Tax=Nocardioides terrisoli TaxID=3388267 RepID=UPI00287B9734|nr:sulfite exporter TauE/SafE family protein [Nocardioides marmorisolisilvae]